MSEPVRPTTRALSDLGLALPPLEVELHLIDNALVQKAQGLPADVAAGGAERIRSLSDHVWFKVKTSDIRGAAGEVDTPAEFGPETEANLSAGAWWLVAAGRRQDDTRNRDFYTTLEAECVRAAKGTSANVNSDRLRPTQVDYRRWHVEATTVSVIALQKQVREAIARSAQTGSVWRVTVQSFQIAALIKRIDGESYLAIAADGFWDAKAVAVLLDAVPSVGAGDWQVEPSDVLGIEPASGQVVFSTMIPADSLSKVLDEVDGHFL
mgnify:CR=1 FL=1